MLIINNLSVNTLKGRTLIGHFSFVLNEGDRIAIIGEEGNGKSTLLKIMAGRDVSAYVTYQGSVNANGGKVGYLEQSIDHKWDESSLLEYLSKDDPLQEIPLEFYDNYPYLQQLLRNFGLAEEQLSQKIGSLSGGEKVKAAISKLLLAGCDYLLLDEPTNDLDLQTLMWLEDFINNADCPVMFISHDETLLENCANGIIHIEQLKKKQEAHITFERLTYPQYLLKRQHNIARINAISRKENAAFNQQLERYRQIYQKVQYQQSTISRQDPHGGRLLKKKMHAVKSLGHKMEEKKANLTAKYEPEEAIEMFFPPVQLNPNKVILDLQLPELTAQGRLLARDIQMHILARNKVCIIGPNGAGKTTLLKLIRLKLDERTDIRVGYLPQNYRDVLNDDISASAFLNPQGLKDRQSQVNSYLGALKFTSEEMTHPISELSEGQKCKLLLMKLIVENCEVLILDEPSRNLSPLSNPQLRQMLIDYGGCIIAVSHDRKFINEVCDSIYLLENQQLKKL